MILSVHDELVFEIHESEIEQVKALAKEVIEEKICLSVPLHVDSSIGHYWGDSHNGNIS